MKQYNYLLFDWDGCLATTLDVVINAYKETFKEYGLTLSTEEIVQKVLGTWDGPLHVGISKDDLESYNKKYLKLISDNYWKVELYPHVKEVLVLAHERGKKIALVTTSKMHMIENALERLEVKLLFDLILTADDVTKHKPDPEMIYKASRELHGNLNETIIIGDSKSDLGAAQNAKIDSVLFHPQENERFYSLEKLKEYHPTFIMKDFNELPEILSL